MENIITKLSGLDPQCAFKRLFYILRKIRIKKEIKRYFRIMAEYIDSERYKENIFYLWRTKDKQTSVRLSQSKFPLLASEGVF